jgi:hypothetical protein
MCNAEVSKKGIIMKALRLVGVLVVWVLMVLVILYPAIFAVVHVAGLHPWWLTRVTWYSLGILAILGILFLRGRERYSGVWWLAFLFLMFGALLVIELIKNNAAH